MHKFGSGARLGLVLVVAACVNLGLVVCLAAEVALAPANTKIEFIGSKPQGRGKHDGGFKQFTGSIKLGSDLAKGQITLEIDTESIYSDTPKLTNHLKTADFFEVRKYPKATFASTSITSNKSGNGTHTITGDLTLHGIKKSISFPATITEKDGALSLNSKFTINRNDFGMTYGPGKINDDVIIMVSVNAPAK
jgi:polyisoprenoid-binding protein YceI